MQSNEAGAKPDVRRASRCLENDNLKEAAEICAEVLTKAPRNARAHYILGAIAQREGRRRDAVDYACRAAQLRPDLAPLQFAAGSLLYRDKSFAAAIELYKAAVERDPTKADYHLGVASALRKLGRNDDASTAILRAAAASPNDARVQYKLGQHLRSIGDLDAAVRAYARALELEPGHALATFWLSATRRIVSEDAGNMAKENREDLFAANEVSASADGVSQAPPTAPREYVVSLYNSYAETFDSHLQGALSYRTPTVVVETLSTLFPRRRWRRCLDLGCGTGLSGQAASAVCDRLVGVDLSPAMVQRAKEKRVYRRLLVGDVTETLRRLCSGDGGRRHWDVPEAPEEEGGVADPPRTQGDGTSSERDADEGSTLPWANADDGVGQNGAQDLVLSCDVFVYIGDLRECFSAVRDLVGGVGGGEGGAVFAFSAEASPLSPGTGGSDPPEYELQGTGRFTHSRAYLERISRETGFRVLAANNVILRKNAGSPVKGFVFIVEAMA